MTSRDPASDCSTGALLTDLYQLTMLQAYDAHGRSASAVFAAECDRRQEEPADAHDAVRAVTIPPFGAQSLPWRTLSCL